MTSSLPVGFGNYGNSNHGNSQNLLHAGLEKSMKY